MGHLLISCGSCYDELRTTTFYDVASQGDGTGLLP
jgi:hypothetical protein